MMMLPIMFKLGVLSTLIVTLVVLAIKSILIGKIIMILQIVSIAIKLASLKFGGGGGFHQEIPHQKEVHLHVHNSGHNHEQHYQPYGQYRRGDHAVLTARNDRGSILEDTWSQQPIGYYYNNLYYK